MKHLKGIPNGVEIDFQKVANKVFETIAMAKVSTSGEEARENNFLNNADGISVNGDHQLYDAKQAVLSSCMKKAIDHLFVRKFLLLEKLVMQLVIRCGSNAPIRIYFRS